MFSGSHLSVLERDFFFNFLEICEDQASRVYASRWFMPGQAFSKNPRSAVPVPDPQKLFADRAQVLCFPPLETFLETRINFDILKNLSRKSVDMLNRGDR
jgi:hypothetical protein